MKRPTKELLHKLQPELRKLDFSIANVNCGGCGLFAEELYNTLSKVGYKLEIGIITRDVEEITNRITNNKNGGGADWSHIVIVTKGVIIDSDGLHSNVKEFHYSGEPTIVTGMSIELLKQWNSIKGDWNPTFDRKKYLPIIKKEFLRIEEEVFGIMRSLF